MMYYNKQRLVCLILIIFFVASVAVAQNLLDNQFYREAEQLRQQAQEALNNGDYALSIQLSQRSQELSEQAYQAAEDLYFAFVARASKRQAEVILDTLSRSSADYTEAEQIAIEDSRAFYNDAVMLLDEEYFELSASAFRNVMIVLDNADIDLGLLLPVIGDVEIVVAPAEVMSNELVAQNQAGEDADMMDEDMDKDMMDKDMDADMDKDMAKDTDADADMDKDMDADMMDKDMDADMDKDMAKDTDVARSVGDSTTLPRFYRVRLIPGDRDSFSRIAAYSFVYGNGNYWRGLYEANKDKLLSPDNPDLIYPGQLLEIPSLRGEKREGEWVPQANN